MPKYVALGSTSQLAAELSRVFGADYVGLSHGELDVAEEARIVECLHTFRPTWVINAASFNRVDECESDSRRAFAVNASGAGNAARAAARVGAGIVWFSTDYVFGGDGLRQAQPYGEEDKPAPLNVYGTSKLLGEDLVRAGNPRHLIVRTAALFGAAGSRKGWTFPDAILRQARTQAEVRVVNDQIVSPTFARDLAWKVREMIEGACTGLFHVTNAGQCSWYEFAQEVLALSNVTAKLVAITSAESARAAKRPAYSVLGNSALGKAGLAPMRPWQAALREYLLDKGEIKRTD